MSLFSKILEKLGLKKDKEEEKEARSTPRTTPSESRASKVGSILQRRRAISEVDVMEKLEGLSAGKDLNWKVSIVDLLKLLDIDSSYEARKELATELGCPPELMSDSAKMNVWLHKTVLRKIAENGGNVPQELLD
ncbi:MAG TPA: DUF3597 domain-containing protein [Anaerolineales bacterium]|nr:DUF3597 domain-containing protein [Anaerolineales bacterium]